MSSCFSPILYKQIFSLISVHPVIVLNTAIMSPRSLLSSRDDLPQLFQSFLVVQRVFRTRGQVGCCSLYSPSRFYAFLSVRGPEYCRILQPSAVQQKGKVESIHYASALIPVTLMLWLVITHYLWTQGQGYQFTLSCHQFTFPRFIKDLWCCKNFSIFSFIWWKAIAMSVSNV